MTVGRPIRMDKNVQRNIPAKNMQRNTVQNHYFFYFLFVALAVVSQFEHTLGKVHKKT